MKLAAHNVPCLPDRFRPRKAYPRAPSVAPEIAEPIRRQLGIANGVLNALMAQVVLKRPGVAPVIGQLVAAGESSRPS